MFLLMLLKGYQRLERIVGQYKNTNQAYRTVITLNAQTFPNACKFYPFCYIISYFWMPIFLFLSGKLNLLLSQRDPSFQIALKAERPFCNIISWIFIHHLKLWHFLHTHYCKTFRLFWFRNCQSLFFRIKKFEHLLLVLGRLTRCLQL